MKYSRRDLSTENFKNNNNYQPLSLKLRRLYKSIFTIAGVSLSLSAQAVPDLIDIYQQAQANDPTFKQAYSIYMSAREQMPQAMSSLLPLVYMTANSNYIKYFNDSGNQVFNGVPQKDHYQQHDFTLALKQPILNYGYWLELKKANHSVKQALATYDDASQNLIIRTSTAYFSILQAKDNVKFTKSQMRSNGRSLDQAKQRFKVGLDAITSVYEAQAAYDSSRSLVISAENNLTNQYENLRILTNHTYKNISPLKRTHVPLVRPEPVNIDSWTDTAIHQNFSLKSKKYTALATKQNISVQNSGHLPSVDFGANYNYTENNSGIQFIKSRSKIATATLTLNLPIYNGGLVVSRTRQASFDYQTASQAYEQQYRLTIVNTRIAYNTIIDGISNIRADRQAVKSAENSLESTSAQFKVGTRTMVDVVAQQRNLFQVQTTLAADQYTYILALLKLKYQAGTLNVNDIHEINTWLQTRRATGKAINQRIIRKRS